MTCSREWTSNWAEENHKTAGDTDVKYASQPNGRTEMAPHKMLELLPGLVACGRSPRLALCSLRVFETGHNAKKIPQVARCHPIIRYGITVKTTRTCFWRRIIPKPRMIQIQKRLNSISKTSSTPGRIIGSCKGTWSWPRNDFQFENGVKMRWTWFSVRINVLLRCGVSSAPMLPRKDLKTRQGVGESRGNTEIVRLDTDRVK